MANLKSAIKRVQTNNTKHARNTSIKSNMRTHIKRTEALIAANEVENAQASFKETTKVIDKAVQKGVIHTNNGTRQKQRLSKKLSTLTA